MAQHFGGAPDVHGLLLLCCAVSMFSLSLVATFEVGTVEVGTVEVGTVEVRTVSDVSYVQWAVDEFSLSQVYFSLIWVWVLGAEMGQIPVESSLSSLFVLVYAGAESKSKVLHSCHHWKSHILTITFNCLGKYLKHLLCKNCTPDKVGFYCLKRSRPYSCPPHSLSPLSPLHQLCKALQTRLLAVVMVIVVILVETERYEQQL